MKHVRASCGIFFCINFLTGVSKMPEFCGVSGDFTTSLAPTSDDMKSYRCKKVLDLIIKKLSTFSVFI